MTAERALLQVVQQGAYTSTHFPKFAHEMTRPFFQHLKCLKPELATNMFLSFLALVGTTADSMSVIDREETLAHTPHTGNQSSLIERGAAV